MTWRAFLVGCALLAAIPAAGALAQSASSGGKTLSASKVGGLNPDGESITVSGSGFDTEKGIYVALCVTPPPGGTPSPCGGGADLLGSSGSSVWISSNPPSYGVGLAVPYGVGGTFSVKLDVGPVIKDGVDCRVLSCAVVTRADHTRLTDRTQDVVLPVTFRAETPATATAGAQPTAAGTVVVATPTASALPTVTPSPTATIAMQSGPPPGTLSLDGKTATVGSLRLSTSQAAELSESGELVTLRGEGYDAVRGVYVALCAVPDPGRAPGPCLAGSTESSAWISSNPPEALKARAMAYGPGGTFEVKLTLKPVIDSSTDCRKLACAISTRNDDTAADDRSQDVLIPVTFAANETLAAVTGTVVPSGPGFNPPVEGDNGGNGVLWIGLAAVVAAAGACGGILLARKRRAAAIVAGLVGALTLFSGCADSDDGASGNAGVAPIVVGTPTAQVLPVTVHSADGREVEITDTTRIVSLWGNVTEVVYGLGLGDRIVGRDSTATFPEVSGLPLVTRGHDTSVEGVLSLNPTLVLASKDNSGPSTALDQIRNVGVPVVVFKDPESVEEIVPRIRLIAAALGVEAAGESLVKATERRLIEVQAEIPANASHVKVAFLYMRGNAGVYLIAGPKSGADSIIRAAGAIDAGTAMGLGQPFTPITSEALASAAPDVILMTTTGLDSVGGLDGLVKIPGIAQTPAGKTKRVITIEDSLLYSFGPRTPLAVETLITALYGGLARSAK